MQRPTDLDARPVGAFGTVRAGTADELARCLLDEGPLPGSAQLPLAELLRHPQPGFVPTDVVGQVQRRAHLG
jgi:hypothetical protein